MKGRKIISLVLSLVMLLSLAVVPASAAEAEEGKTFEDVQEHWGKDSVERWAGYGVLKGDETGAFNPDKSMTRAEFATMLVNLMGYTEKAENTFADVPADAWYADAVLKLAAAGVMQGDGVNANPNATISREETAVLLCRAMNITPSATASVDFADAGSVASWAQDAVAALVERGMIQGMGDNQFAPTLNITRASVAKMVDNMVAVYVVDEAQEITGEVKGVVIVAANADVTVKDATLAENLIVAPKAADATVALTGKTVAQDVIVSAAGAAVKVEKDAKAASVVADAPKAEVAVAGTVTEVKSTAAAEGSSLTVEKGAKVETVATDAPKGSVSVNENVKSVVAGENATEGTVEVAKGVTVDTLTTDAPIKVDNKGTVKKAEVNTSDVVIDGNAPKELDVPKGVDKPTNSDGKEVKEDKPSGGGSSSGSDTPSTPTYKYTAGVVKVGNGTVSIAPANSNDADTEVEITVQADPGWKVGTVELTTKPSESAASISNNKFTMDKEGAYTVTVTFVQPLSKFGVFVAKTADDMAKLKDYGVTDEQIANAFGAPKENHPWLVIAAQRGNGAEANDKIATNDVTIKVNGTTKPATWNGSAKEGFIIASLYVNEAEDGTREDALNFDGPAATIEVSVTFKDVIYTADCPYTKPGVTQTYTLTFTDPAGGNDTITYIVGTGENQNAPAAPTRTGYTFAGWKQDGADNVTVAAGAQISSIAADASYTAQWTAKSCDLTYNYHGATGDNTPANKTVTFGDAYGELPTPTKTGYTFKGWFTEETGGTQVTAATVMTTEGATIHAQWTADTYTITYALNGGTNDPANTATYAYGTGLTLTNPSKTNSTFLGWYSEATFENKVTAIANTDTGNKTLYALWLDPQTTVITRTQGMEEGTEADYAAAYANAGVALVAVDAAEGEYKTTINVEKLTATVNNPDGTNFKVMENSGNAGVLWLGVEYTSIPSGATKYRIDWDSDFATASSQRVRTFEPGNHVYDYIQIWNKTAIDTAGQTAYIVWLDENEKIVAATKSVITVEADGTVEDISSVVTAPSGVKVAKYAAKYVDGDTTTYKVILGGEVASGLGDKAQSVFSASAFTEAGAAAPKTYVTLKSFETGDIKQVNPALALYKVEEMQDDIFNKEDSATIYKYKEGYSGGGDYDFMLISGEDVVITKSVDSVVTIYEIINNVTITSAE